MPQEQNEQDQFLKDLEPNHESALDQPITPEVAPTTDEVETDEEAGNRRERRLQAKLQAERESAIALAAKLEVLTAAQNARSSESSEYLKSVERIYGTGTPEAIEATELLKSALVNVKKEATQDALDMLRKEQEAEREAVASEEKTLERMVEDIEDTYGVTLDDKAQVGFYQLLEKLSPKDANGNVTAFADHHAVYEELQARKAAQPTNRAKDIASRSMARTGASPSTSAKPAVDEAWLMQNGLI